MKSVNVCAVVLVHRRTNMTRQTSQWSSGSVSTTSIRSFARKRFRSLNAPPSFSQFPSACLLLPLSVS